MGNRALNGERSGSLPPRIWDNSVLIPAGQHVIVVHILHYEIEHLSRHGGRWILSVESCQIHHILLDYGTWRGQIRHVIRNIRAAVGELGLKLMAFQFPFHFHRIAFPEEIQFCVIRGLHSHYQLLGVCKTHLVP